MQRHPLPRERQHRLVLLRGQHQRMQCRIEKRWVDAESADLRAGVFGEATSAKISSPTATRPADRETPDRIRSPGLPAGRTHRRGPAPSRPPVAMPSTAPLKQPPPAPIHLRHVMTIPKVTGRRANTLRLSGDPTGRRGPPPPVTALRRRSAEPTAPTGSVLPLPRIRPHRRRGSPTRQSPPREQHRAGHRMTRQPWLRGHR